MWDVVDGEIVVAAGPGRIMRNRDERVIFVAPGIVRVSREWRAPGISMSFECGATLWGPFAQRGIHQTVIPFRFCRVAGGPYVMKSRIAGTFSTGRPSVRSSRKPCENSVILPRHDGHARRRACVFYDENANRKLR